MDIHTLEKNIVSKVRNGVDYVMTTVETRVQDAVWTAMENFVIPRVQLAMKSVKASSVQKVDGKVLEPDQRDNIEDLQMTASSGLNSCTNLKRIDETRGNVTEDGGYLLANERKLDRQTHIHVT